MIRHIVRRAIVCASAVILAWAVCPPPARAAEPQAGIDAEVVYRVIYSGLKRQKAMAIGPAGTWGYGYDYRSVAEAERGAMKVCLAAARARNWGKNAKCKIFARNGKLVGNMPFMGVPLDKALPLPDTPLKRAAQFWPKDTRLKGIVLALHGCNGPGYGIPPFTDTWFSFFKARGFLVIYPSSFDEQRPPEFCGVLAPENYRRFTESVKFRVAQTKRTIAELQKSHPGVPIYIWAHSEGGYVAQALDIKLSGMIIVGTVCGFSTPRAVLVPRSVPILHVYGEFDEPIPSDNILTRKDLDKLCGPLYRSKTRSWVIAAGADHLTSIWRQNVIDAVSRLIGQKSFNLAETKTPVALEGEALTAYEKSYQKIGKTAFAIGPNGAFGIAGQWSNAEDTRQDALDRCARAIELRSQNALYPPGGKQPCRLYAVGDKPLTQ